MKIVSYCTMGVGILLLLAGFSGLRFAEMLLGLCAIVVAHMHLLLLASASRLEKIESRLREIGSDVNSSSKVRRVANTETDEDKEALEFLSQM